MECVIYTSTAIFLLCLIYHALTEIHFFNIRAMGNLALAFATGKHGIKKNPKKAKKWLVKAAEANDSQSQYHLGECYYVGAAGIDPLMCWGRFPLSLKDAYKLHLLAADKGLWASYHRLADMYRTGNLSRKIPTRHCAMNLLLCISKRSNFKAKIASKCYTMVAVV